MNHTQPTDHYEGLVDEPQEHAELKFWKERYDRQQRLIYPERYAHVYDASNQNGSCARCGKSLLNKVHYISPDGSPQV